MSQVGGGRPSLAARLRLDLLDEVVDVAPSTVHAWLDESGLGDGLPPGTVRSQDVAAFVASLGGDPASPIVQVPPLRQPLTAHRLAVCALLAGCRADQAPVLRAVVEALPADDLNAYGVLTTTGTAALMVIVNGPVRDAVGHRSGANCLGPGNRANATTGRFLSLVTRIVGGAREGMADMATMGQPGKYSFCLAEAEEASPWPSLATDRGVAAGTSAVSIVAVSGTSETFDPASYDPEAMVAAIAGTMVSAEPPVVADGRASTGRPRSLVLLSPEWADAFADAGMGKGEVRSMLARAAADHPSSDTPDPEALPILLVCGGPGIKQTVAPLWSGGSTVVTVPVEDG